MYFRQTLGRELQSMHFGNLTNFILNGMSINTYLGLHNKAMLTVEHLLSDRTVWKNNVFQWF